MNVASPVVTINNYTKASDSTRLRICNRAGTCPWSAGKTLVGDYDMQSSEGYTAKPEAARLRRQSLE